MSAAGQLPLIDQLARVGVLSPLDRHLARAVHALPGADEDVALGAALASRAVQLGHVCVDLTRLDFHALCPPDELARRGVAWPERGRWLEALGQSPLCHVRTHAPASPLDAPAPLVLEARGQRLYLQRYARYEQTLAALLRGRARRLPDVDLPRLQGGIRRLFGADASSGGGAQALVACVAALHALAVICGGPGTGKTTTVVKILALLQEQALARGERALNVLLLAPTGKAARRLASSVQAGLAALPVSAAVRDAIPNEAYTIHRALGGGASGRFRHDAQSPLPADVVLVDEVSMVDLALLYRLSIAIRPQARLILQGDKDQLSSVEAGAILGDIYDSAAAAAWSQPFAEDVATLTGRKLEPTRPERGLYDCLVSLDESFRYRADSGIGRLARAINAGDGAAALGVLRAPAGGEWDAELFEPELPGQPARALEARAVAGYTPFIRANDPAEKLEQLGRYRVLCALRQGRLG
ncbi:MAG TPA: AAA family ATPase, partial [Polyangiaceae bacterium]|nr:AAA family ATPase [Polyangiaceae bacterium]